MARDGVDHGAVGLARSADVRYGRQSWELEVGVPSGMLDEAALDTIATEFHARHRQAYGYAMETEALIVVNAQVSAIAALPKPPLGSTKASTTSTDGAAVAMAHDQPGERQTWLGGRWVPASVYDRRGLPPGVAIEGPAIVEQLDTTTFLGLGDRARVDESGNLVLEVAR
jgi:N-methylhydantoinase A/oxoprolinase/acetone carboxylase beta subunit